VEDADRECLGTEGQWQTPRIEMKGRCLRVADGSWRAGRRFDFTGKASAIRIALFRDSIPALENTGVCQPVAQ
jgi:hypothetical protein